jgi:hypothetical protein
MVNGNLEKEDFKLLKARYVADEARLNAAIENIGAELDDVLAGKAERLRWMEHFRRFEEMTALDRRIVTNLISHIRVEAKTEIQIKFNYQDEYESAARLLQKGAA